MFACLHAVLLLFTTHATVNDLFNNLITVTPIEMFFICNLTRIACTSSLCYCLLLLTNVKYGLG